LFAHAENTIYNKQAHFNAFWSWTIPHYAQRLMVHESNSIYRDNNNFTKQHESTPNMWWLLLWGKR